MVDSSKQKSPDTAGYFKSIFEPYVWKNTSNKIMYQIFTFLIILTGLIAYIYMKPNAILIHWAQKYNFSLALNGISIPYPSSIENNIELVPS